MNYVRTNYKKRDIALLLSGAIVVCGVTAGASQTQTHTQAPVFDTNSTNYSQTHNVGVKLDSARSNVNDISTNYGKTNYVNGISVKFEKKPTFVNGI